MNNLPPEMLIEMSRQKIKEEMDLIQLEEEVSNSRNFLTMLGEWLISFGEKLSKKDSISRTNSSELTKRVA